MDEITQQLDKAIARLQNASLSGLSRVELTATLKSWETLSRRLEAGVRGLVAEIDRRGVAGEYGAASTSALVRDVLLVSPHEAAVRVRQARDLMPRVALSGEVLPPLFEATAAALDFGAITLAHAKVITRFRTDLPGSVDAKHGDEAEKFLVGKAAEFNPVQLHHIARRLLDTLNPDGKFNDSTDQERHRHFTVIRHKDGSSTGTFHFTPELTAIVSPVLDSLSKPQPSEGMPDTRTAAQRGHDAVAEVFMRVLRSGTLPDSGGTPVTVLVHTTAEDLVKASNGEHVLATTDHDILIPLETIVAITAEIQIAGITLRASGGIACYGTTKRLATVDQRRALAARDKGCCFPGCERPSAWAEVHHILEWIKGGTTDLINLVLLCRFHHRHFEAAGWTVRINTDEVPEWLPPAWLDQEQRPRRNTIHDRPKLPEFV